MTIANSFQILHRTPPAAQALLAITDDGRIWELGPMPQVPQVLLGPPAEVPMRIQTAFLHAVMTHTPIPPAISVEITEMLEAYSQVVPDLCTKIDGANGIGRGIPFELGVLVTTHDTEYLCVTIVGECPSCLERSAAFSDLDAIENFIDRDQHHHDVAPGAARHYQILDVPVHTRAMLPDVPVGRFESLPQRMSELFEEYEEVFGVLLGEFPSQRYDGPSATDVENDRR